MITWLSVVPAYGRDYRSKAQVMAAWQAGKDFRIVSPREGGGTYVNRDDLPPGVVLVVYYDRTTRECLITGVT